MARPIIVPLDGSVFAAQALPLAQTVAARSGAPVHAVRVHAPVPILRRHMLDVQTVAAYEDRRLRAAASRHLEEVARELGAELGEEQVSTALLDGPVGKSLVAYAQERDASLVVMATRGRGPLGRAVLGSVAEDVLRQSGVPVLLVRADPEGAGPPRAERFERVLVPLDGSDHSAEVVEHALAVGGREAHYTLVRVAPPASLTEAAIQAIPVIPEDALPPAWERHAAEGADAELGRRAAMLRDRGYTVDVRLVLSARPSEEIVRVAEEIGAGLIAMTTRRRGLAARLLLGSVAGSVLQRASTPVLIYCPQLPAWSGDDEPLSRKVPVTIDAA